MWILAQTYGNYLEFIKKILKQGKYFVFEPIESLVKELSSKLITEKDKIYNVALSDKEKKIFNIYEIPSQSSFYIQNDTYKSVQKIKKEDKNKNTSIR